MLGSYWQGCFCCLLWLEIRLTKDQERKRESCGWKKTQQNSDLDIIHSNLMFDVIIKVWICAALDKGGVGVNGQSGRVFLYGLVSLNY